MAALKHSDRVHSLSLTVTSSLREKLSAIERPFSELEDLVLLSRERETLTLPGAFQWGPRLRTLHLTGAAIPALPELLLPSTSLVDLQLHNIPQAGYFSPVPFVNALSGMAQLRLLSLHFLSDLSFSLSDCLSSPPRSGERVVLPALTCLKYRGTTMYLDSFVARIDAPHLRDIDITFHCRQKMSASQLGQFLNRIEIQKSHTRAEILFSQRTVSISFNQTEAPARLGLQVSSNNIRRQLSHMAQICNSLSPFLLGVENLRIGATQPPGGQDDDNLKGWLGLICAFRGTKWVYLSGNQSTNIVLALCLRQHEAVLPALHKLCVREHEPLYLPLQEAVVSFIHSRRLSGQIICIEYERVQVDELQPGTKFVQCRFVSRANFHGVEPSFRQVTSEMLPDDALLNIFRLYLQSSPQFWPTLTHISKRWRHLVFTSPLGLDLRLYCTYGTPVSKTLDCWPVLPIVVQYGEPPALGSPTPEDEDNIVAALKHSDRVTSIDLAMTSSLLDRLSVIETPFSELEELVLRSADTVKLTHSSTLRWGTRLRRLHLTRIAFPALLELLSASMVLVDLQLHEIPKFGYFSPEAFANALSGITQLETLSLHFLSFPSRRNHLGLPPQSGERIVLPSLICLKYRGTSKFLDNFVARIDAPHLEDIHITFFNQPTMDAWHLGRFMERIEMQMLLSQAVIQLSEIAVSFSFAQPSGPTRFELRISCEQLDWQLSSIAQIFEHFSPFIFRVEDLRINTIQLSSEKGNMDDGQWLGLLHSFRGVKEFSVGSKLVTDILVALRVTNAKRPIVLPSLRTFRLPKLTPMHGLFTTSRLLESGLVQVYAQERSCKICRANFTEQQELKKHLVVMHAYRLVCPYCGDFEFSPRYSDLFGEHLASKHPEIAPADTLVLSSQSQSQSFFSSHSGRHDAQNNLRASVNFEAFTTLKINASNVPWPESPEDIPTQLDTVVYFVPFPHSTWSFEDT